MPGLKLCVAILLAAPLARPQDTHPPNLSAATVLSRYCVSCHNPKVKAAVFAMDLSETDRAASHAEIWEKVVRKLRTNAMPPAGLPRPNQPTVDSVASFLEGHVYALQRLDGLEA